MYFVANVKVTEENRLLTRSFFPRVFDRLLWKLSIVIRLRVIVVYGRPEALFNLVITGSSQICRQLPCKRRVQLNQYVVGAPMERIAIDILGPLPETRKLTILNSWLVTISQNGLRYIQCPTRRPPLLQRSL